MRNYPFKTFTTEQGVYPTTYFCFDPMDCTPNNPNALYTLIDHCEDDDYEDDDEQVEIQIPNRMALYDLIKDLNNQVNSEIINYAKLGSAPLDDATYDIYIAIDIISDLKSFDDKDNLYK